jgi:hypothetical protein
MAWRKSLHSYADGGQIITMPTRAAVRAAFNTGASPMRMASGYDTGGMMMPGGVGANYGSKPERVMSGSQTEWFEAGRAAAGKSGGGSSGVIDYDRLASAMARVRIDLDGRNVARSVDRRLGLALA